MRAAATTSKTRCRTCCAAPRIPGGAGAGDRGAVRPVHLRVPRRRLPVDGRRPRLVHRHGPVPQVPARWHACGYWTFKQARSGDVTPELEGWPASYDVLFIDGDHSTLGVLADLRRFVPYVAAGGVVLCHDTKLVNPAEPGAPREVAVGLDLFCAEYHLAARELPWAPRERHPRGAGHLDRARRPVRPRRPGRPEWLGRPARRARRSSRRGDGPGRWPSCSTRSARQRCAPG